MYSQVSIIFALEIKNTLPFILPLLILIFLNLNLHINGRFGKSFLFISILSIMQVLDVLQNYFAVVEFIKWNLFYGLFVNVGYIISGLGISKVLLIISNNKGQKNDSYL